MRFTNEQTLQTEFSADYGKKTYGIVVKSNTETGDRTLGVYVGKLMPAIGMDNRGAREWTDRLSHSKLKNKKNSRIGDTSIDLKNYMTVPPLTIPNMNLPRYVRGERIILDVMDEDIKSFAYLPYSVEDVNMRTEDSQTFFVVAKGEEGEEIGESNTYFLKLDSVEGVAAIHLANGNGEKLPYTIVIDQKKNKRIAITDSERTWALNSENDEITFFNKEGSYVKMEGNKITEYSEIREILSEEHTIKTKEYKLEADNMEITAKTLKEKIDDVDASGNKKKEKYKAMEHDGNTFKADYNTTDWIDNNHYIGGKILSKSGIYFDIKNPKDPGIPIKPHIDGGGTASLENPGVASVPLVKFPQLVPILTQLGVSIDALYGMFGVPPQMSSTLPPQIQQLPTYRSKG